MISLGGATEAAIWSIFYDITNYEGIEAIPYGQPLANQKFYVLDKELEQCPDYVVGEIVIAGEGLAEKYLNDISSEKLGTIKEYVVLKSGVISAVINSKLSECRRNNILIETSISDCVDGFSDIDISILLSNLFDNAIEACMKLHEGRCLSFHMFLHMGYLRIVMKNSVDSNDGGNMQLLTTKSDRKNHGFGINTIKEISENKNLSKEQINEEVRICRDKMQREIKKLDKDFSIER